MKGFLDLYDYTKLEKIGTRTFGKVYKVVDERTGEIFAAKVSKNALNEEKKRTQHHFTTRSSFSP